MPIIGAHVSAAGGAYRCFQNAKNIGAEAIQIFGASPRAWKVKQPSQEDIKKFKEEQRNTGLGPVFLHASYLVNLGTHKNPLWHGSVTNLAAHLKIAEDLGAEGLIFHIGSAKGWTKKESIERVAKGMKEVLKKVPGKAQLIMENAAGGGDKIGATVEEIGKIFKKVKSKRAKVCLDTQHAFAAGMMKEYTPKSIKAWVKECDEAFGWDNVVAMHINDSKSEHLSNHDRHENIGEGFIGRDAFKNLAANKDMKKMPWLLEVPGFEGGGPDKENINILKKL